LEGAPPEKPVIIIGDNRRWKMRIARKCHGNGGRPGIEKWIPSI
jgi:hypothetical protein